MSFFTRLFGRAKKDGEEAAPEGESATPADAPAPAANSAPPAPAPAAPAAPAVKASPAPAPAAAAPKAAATKAAAAGGGGATATTTAAPPRPAAPSPVGVKPSATNPSLRPAANGGAKGAEVVDAVLGSLDASFTAIFSEGQGGEGRTEDSDKMAMLELFYEIAANHLKPVRNFMTELALGDARREWIAIARPAADGILQAAKQIGVPELEKRLTSFLEIFNQVEGSTAFMISGEVRQAFLERYQKLAQFLPKAFALGDGRDKNESLLTHSLLLQIPDVRKVTIDKLYRAGLSAMEVLFLATREDLAATTGIRSVLAERIVDKFKGYRDTHAAQKKDQKAARATELGKLAGLLGELKSQHVRYEQGQMSLSDSDKRSLRLQRQASWLDVTVVLAELGEADRVGTWEKLPFEQKIRELEGFLKQHAS